MSRIINAITIFPFYSIILRMLHSPIVTGDVFFTVNNTKGALVLNMQTVQIPLMAVIKLTLPKINEYKETLTWKDICSSIVWGKLIYPL
ncbi:hypothetical protein X975_03866, partial [Stegodyphus mimosarum]